MSEIKGLAKDTAIYGVSSIVGKFINYLLVPMFTRLLPTPGDYGIVTNLYAWSALLIAILTYGMETGFFYYAAREKDEKGVNRVYTTAMTSLLVSSLLFMVAVTIFQTPIACALNYGDHPEFVAMLFATVAMDAFCSIPFSYLRYKRKSVTFAAIKIAIIFMNVIMNVFFLWICPKINITHPELISWFYRPDYGVGYILIANVIQTAFGTLLLLPFILRRKWCFSGSLFKQMMGYSWPILLTSVVGIANQSIDRILYPYLQGEAGMDSLGIYGACFKIAMVMMMFTYAFKFAYEPFAFDKSGQQNDKQTYAVVMKYYIITTWLIFLGIVANTDLLGLLIDEQYREGLKIIPIVLASYLLQGVFYNLSLWYKLTKKTYWGAILSAIGLIVTIVLNIVLVPRFSYMACVWATFASFFIITALSYILEHKYYPIKYDLNTIGIYTALALVLFVPMLLIKTDSLALNLVLRNLFLIPFVWYLVTHDMPLAQLPFVGKYFKKKQS